LGAVDIIFWLFVVRRPRHKIVTSFAILILGLIVTAITGVGAVLIGFEEASDASQSQLQDLTELEKKIVGRSEKTG
jgi:uncharacterized membrane protein YeiB